MTKRTAPSTRHPAFDTACPPGLDTLAHYLMLAIATGTPPGTVAGLLDSMSRLGGIADFFPDQAPIDLEEALALLWEIIGAHNACTRTHSPHTRIFRRAQQDFLADGVVLHLSTSLDDPPEDVKAMYLERMADRYEPFGVHLRAFVSSTAAGSLEMLRTGTLRLQVRMMEDAHLEADGAEQGAARDELADDIADYFRCHGWSVAREEEAVIRIEGLTWRVVADAVPCGPLETHSCCDCPDC